MSARDELTGIVQNACAQTSMDWVYDHEAQGVAEAILAAGYSKQTITGYAVLDRGGHMIGEQFKERKAAEEFAAEWTKDCKDAGIDWDYRVAAITEAAA